MVFSTSGSITVAGVKLYFTGAPQADDQFVVGASSHQTQSALDTLSQLRQALETPVDGNILAQVKLKDSVNAAISNLSNASDQVDNVRGSIGARLNAIDIQSAENDSIGLVNTRTQAAIGDTDVARVYRPGVPANPVAGLATGVRENRPAESVQQALIPSRLPVFRMPAMSRSSVTALLTLLNDVFFSTSGRRIARLGLDVCCQPRKIRDLRVI